MNLANFGATGGTGRQLVDQALEEGHAVTVLVRNPAAFSLQHERLSPVEGDVRDRARVKAVVTGQDAILSA
jgi:putative NADH-flavin reductase